MINRQIPVGFVIKGCKTLKRKSKKRDYRRDYEDGGRLAFCCIPRSGSSGGSGRNAEFLVDTGSEFASECFQASKYSACFVIRFGVSARRIIVQLLRESDDARLTARV